MRSNEKSCSSALGGKPMLLAFTSTSTTFSVSFASNTTSCASSGTYRSFALAVPSVVEHLTTARSLSWPERTTLIGTVPQSSFTLTDGCSKPTTSCCTIITSCLLCPTTTASESLASVTNRSSSAPAVLLAF